MCEATGNGSWGPNETEWAKLLAQLVVFKEKSGGARLVERGAGRMGEQPGQIREGLQEARAAMRTHTQETLQSASEAGKRFYSRKRHERSQGPGQSLNSMTMTRSTIFMSALTSSAVSGRL